MNDCICDKNWQAIVKESEPLLDKTFFDETGNTYSFIGVMHSLDDYYYCMMSGAGKLQMLSCVGNIETHGFKLSDEAHKIKAKTLHFDDKHLHVELADGRVISTPMDWYKELQNASFSQLEKHQFVCEGTGIEWTDLDYQLSIGNMLQPTT